MIHIKQALHTITDPNFTFYYPIRLFLTGSLVYISSSLLLNLSLKEQSVFILSVLAINRLTYPLFKKIFEPYLHISLVNLIGRVTHLATSVLLSQAVCYLFNIRLTLKQICALSALYCLSLYVTHFIYGRIIQSNVWQPAN